MPKIARGQGLGLIEETLDGFMETIREQNRAKMEADGLCEADISAFAEMSEADFQEWKRATLTTLCFELYGATLMPGPEGSQ